MAVGFGSRLVGRRKGWPRRAKAGSSCSGTCCTSMARDEKQKERNQSKCRADHSATSQGCSAARPAVAPNQPLESARGGGGRVPSDRATTRRSAAASSDVANPIAGFDRARLSNAIVSDRSRFPRNAGSPRRWRQASPRTKPGLRQSSRAGSSLAPQRLERQSWRRRRRGCLGACSFPTCR